MDPSTDFIATILFLLTSALFTAFYFIFVLPKKRFEHLPGPPVKSYLLGHLRELTCIPNSMPQTLLRMALEHGPTFRVFLPLQTFYVVTHPDDVRFVTSTRNYPKAPGFVESFNDLAPGGLLTADPHSHPVQRTAIAKHFNPKQLPRLAEHVQREMAVLIAKLDAAALAQSRVNIDDDLVSCLLDTIARITVGETLGAQKDPRNPVVAAFHASVEEVYKNMMHTPFRRPLPWTQRRLRANTARLHSFLKPLIAQRAQEAGAAGAAGAERPHTLLDTFRAVPGATEESVLGNVTVFLFAGHDTTAHTLSFLIYEACRDLSLQARLAAEIDAVMGDLTGSDGAAPDAALVCELAFCAQAWQEALRMHPSAANGSVRRADRADVLPHSGFPVEPGVKFFVPPYVAHRHPRFWDAPDQFRPERWARKALAAPRARDRSFFPYSAGARNCIGRFLARFEALYAVAAIFGRYRVALDCDPGRVKAHNAVTMRPQADLPEGPLMGLPVTFTRRKFRE